MFTIIENKSSVYPIYFVINTLTGQQVYETLNKAQAEKMKEEYNLYGLLEV